MACHVIYGLGASLFTVAVGKVDERRLFCALDACSSIHSDGCW